MKISFKRMLALVLCAAMVFGMLPMQQVKAEDDYFIAGFVANNTAELVDALTEAKQIAVPGKLVTIQVGETFELTENVFVPSDCRLDVPVPFSVGAGVTVEISGAMEVVAGMTNQGTLINNGNVTVYGSIGGSLAFVGAGKYTGTGEMKVINSTYEDIIPGIDLSGYDAVQGQGIGGVRWTITPKESAELVPDEWGNYSFTTMEQLKQLASKYYDSWTWANYAGEEPFVIDESITLPDNLPLGSNGAPIVIAEDVTVNLWEAHFDKLVVNGTLNVGNLQLYKELEVNGKINVQNATHFNLDAVINGAENITYIANATMGYWCVGYDLQSLKEACVLAANETNPKVRYSFSIQQEGTLTEDLMIPANMMLNIQAPVTVAAGATLTNYANMYMYAPVTVQGTLQNDGWAMIDYPNAKLTIAEGATYSGNGALIIHGITDGDPMKAVPGIDLTGYELSQWDDQNTWQIVPEGYIPDGEGGSGGGGLTFSSVEELKELASQTYADWTWISYTGEEDLEITEDIELPENLNIRMNSYGVRIAEGVTAKFNYLRCSWLEINGDLYADYVQITGESLRVNGSLTVEESVDVVYSANISNIDRIHMVNNWSTINLVYDGVGMNLAWLRELIAGLDPYEPLRMRRHVFLDAEETVIEEDLVVPGRVNVYFEKPLTIAAGATLTLNSDNADFAAPVTVYGTLENNSWLSVRAHNGANITFAEGGTYAGVGTIGIEKPAEMALESVLPGLDLSNMYIREDGYNWCYVSKVQQGGGNDGITFSSFEELKELASRSWNNWTWVTYVGEGDLEITEDITIPNNLNIQSFNSGVRIAEGVSAQFGYLHCRALEIAGDLHAVRVSASEYLKVTGALTVDAGISITEHTELTGRDRITFTHQGNGISKEFYDVDLNRLKELNAEVVTLTDSRVRYVVYTTEEAIVLEESLTLVNKLNPYFNGPLTVASGATLTLNSDNAQLYAPATVYGNLENNSWLYVGAYNGATLTFAEGSTYTGTGTIAVEKDPSVPLESVLPGLDLSNLFVTQDGDWWWYVTTEPFNPGGGGDNLTFSTLEELKALAAESYDWGYMVYTGSEDFVISEDISLPVNTYVDFNGVNLIINEGTTAAFCQMSCEDLTVDGNLIAEYAEAMGDVVVRGTIKTMGLNIGEESEITGLENIKFTNSYNPLSRTYFVGTGEELVAALNKAANPKLPKEFANIQLNGGPVILTEDATLPKNCELYISNDMVIAEGATLTINGYVSIGCPLVVQGTLVNNYDIYTWDSKMIIAQGGKYEGRGTLRVVGGSDYKTAFRGLNLEDFQITNNYGEWHLVYVVGLPPVAAPSELEWGYTYDDGVKVALPGAVSWKSGITDTTGMEYVYFYRINEDGTETLMNEYGGVGYDAKNYMDGYNSSVELLLSDIPSGKYYFTVYSQGDYKNTRDSETVTSPVWEYTKPTDRLETATDLGWSDEGFRAEWTNPNNVEEVHYTLVSWYYKNSENGYEYTFGRFVAQEDEAYELTDFYLSMMGTGYYSYDVQFISADITKTLSSELGERSDWYHLEKMPETPTAQLGGLLNDPDKSNEEKLEEVQNMGTDTLKEIIEEVANAMDILVQLENIVASGTAQVDVSAEVVEEIAELVVEEISIVGANLNSKVDEDLGVTLVIDKVEEVREITGNYDTSTAVQFSMTLDNVKDTKNLEVPVVVTIPVPAGIAADKVVVLHYHDDGTYDVINPEVTILGGKTYATFILTSFSDFAILEKLAALLGDVDLNEGVDVDDVLALLWAVLFPDMYSVEVEADFDHNGSVDVDDVLTLLWYVLFPDMYPLS